MRKLIESTMVTLDGVISNPQDYGPPYWDDEHSAHASELLFGADALLLGRVTYEGFAQSWPSRSGDDFTDRINSMPKYVASKTLQDTTWNATVLGSNTADEIARLKKESGGHLLKYGTGELDRTLLIPNQLVDEFHFWMFPVVAGDGDRLLPGLDMTHFDLVGTTQFKSGIVVLKYAPK
jgi:dihydrofolate reductase